MHQLRSSEWTGRKILEKLILFVRYLYRAMIAMDANFRLKNQLVSSWSRDPGMGLGTAYFVEHAGFEEYIKSRINEDDVSDIIPVFDCS